MNGEGGVMEQSWNGLLPNLDLEAVSLKDTRAKLMQHLGLDADALEAYKAEVTQILQQATQALAFSESLPPGLCSSDRAQMISRHSAHIRSGRHPADVKRAHR